MSSWRRPLRLPIASFAALLLATLLAGCGSSTHAVSSGDVHIVCHTQSLSVEVGATLLITGCPAGTVASSASSGMALSTTTTAGLSFVARTVGNTTVSLDRHPVCSPGVACPDYVVIVAVLQIHVTS